MKVKQPAILQQLRKDPKALQQLVDFLRNRNGSDPTVGQITVDNQTYKLRRSPTPAKTVGY